MATGQAVSDTQLSVSILRDCLVRLNVLPHRYTCGDRPMPLTRPSI